ncbi:hypothetical protein [Ructibacterium gallinarum]|uniref:Uncharacterized protein n=1 Tax=Ructibacterium gallinarum TaxID=2779355 RepID=A0A9D5M1W6_9FIRM|nr:hypothetical protein [Ructibacterium gallinarum]MBE5040785.1 hypothetical protein [Ructibacterium gallinarum]
MGWFGMPGHDRRSAFRELMSQEQYVQRFALLWKKHMKSKSIAVYSLDGKVCGETILWAEEDGELIYKPISWADSIKYIPQKLLSKLLENASDLEKECYEASKIFRLEAQ